MSDEPIWLTTRMIYLLVFLVIFILGLMLFGGFDAAKELFSGFTKGNTTVLWKGESFLESPEEIIFFIEGREANIYFNYLVLKRVGNNGILQPLEKGWQWSLDGKIWNGAVNRGESLEVMKEKYRNIKVNLNGKDSALIDTIKLSLDKYFEIKNSEGKNIFQVFKTNFYSEIFSYNKEGYYDYNREKFSERGFNENNIKQLEKALSEDYNGLAKVISAELDKLCISSNKEYKYFLEIPQGIISNGRLLKDFFPNTDKNYRTIITTQSDYKGVFFNIKLKVLEECFANSGDLEFSKLSQKNKEFVNVLSGKSPEQGLNMIVQRVVNNEEGNRFGWFDVRLKVYIGDVIKVYGADDELLEDLDSFIDKLNQMTRGVIKLRELES